MDALSRVIKKILGSTPGLKEGLDEARVLEIWPKAVGVQIANHAKAIKIRGKTIMISVDHPVWKQELMANRRMVLDKLNKTLAEHLGDLNDQSARIDEIFIVHPSKAPRAYPKR